MILSNKKPFIALFIFILICIGFLLTKYDTSIIEGFVMSTFLIYISVSVLYLTNIVYESKFIVALFLVTIFFHFCLSFFTEFIWTNFERNSDGAIYSKHAELVANSWKNGTFASYEAVVPYRVSAKGYVYAVATTFFIINKNTIYIKLINGLLASISVIYIYKIGATLFNKESGKFAALFTALMPSLVLWTSQNLKDSSIMFLSVFIFWQSLEIVNKKVYKLPVLLLCIFVLTTIRIETAIGLGVILSITQFMNIRGSMTKKLVIGGIIVLTIGWTLQRLGYGFLGSQFFSTKINIEAINERRSLTAYGGTAVDIGTKTSSLVDFIFYLPIAIANFLLRPWPWEATNSIQQIATIPESVFIWYPMFILAIIGLIQAARKLPIRSLSLLLYVVGSTIAAAPQYGNLGTAYRHRVQLWPFFFLLGGYAWYNLLSHSTRRYNMVTHEYI